MTYINIFRLSMKVLQIKNTVGFFTAINSESLQMDFLRSTMSSILMLCGMFFLSSVIPQADGSVGKFLLKRLTTFYVRIFLVLSNLLC